MQVFRLICRAFTFVVCREAFLPFLESEQGGAFARVALGPRRIDLNGFLGIVQGFLRLSGFQIGRRAVRVENVIGLVQLDGITVGFNGFVKLASRQSCVALLL